MALWTHRQPRETETAQPEPSKQPAPQYNRFLVFFVSGLIVYIIAFAISLGPVYWLMSSEIFPNRLRGRGASFAATANWAANLLVSVTFLSLIGAIGKSFTFWLYAALAVAAFIFCLKLVPETKGKRLEQIEEFWENGRRWEQVEGQEAQNQQG